MGFLQRGFAYGNRRGFAIPEVVGGEEEELLYNAAHIVRGGTTPKVGQRRLIPNHKVLNLSLVLEIINGPVGDVFFAIAGTSDNYEYVKERLCDASEIALGANWYKLQFSSPPIINDEVVMYVEFQGGDGVNHIRIHYQNSDVKANENLRAASPLCWYEYDFAPSNYDCAYKYEYQAMGAPAGVYSIEQLCGISGFRVGDATVSRCGQKLTIPNREVTHLGFWLRGAGAPTGNVVIAIRRVSDDGLICSKVWGDASALDLIEYEYKEVEFEPHPTINEEVRAYAEFENGDAVNRVWLWHQNTEVKGNEGMCYFSFDPVEVWADGYVLTRDCRYLMRTLLV